jgi:hypothetical protein
MKVQCSYYLDVRWTLIVSGFEALMNTSENGVARQFSERVRQLDDIFKVGISDRDLKIAYKLRSKIVHAEEFLAGLQKILPQTKHSDLYLRLESLLRKTIERSLLDKTFGDSFSSAADVNKHWPLNALQQRSWICRKLKSICSW